MDKYVTIANGSRFDNLTIIKVGSSIYYEPSGKRRMKALVKCDCGEQFEIPTQYLTRTGQKCSKCHFNESSVVSIGETYDRLTVIGFDPNNGRKLAICQCDCGNHINIRPELLKINQTNNCGCHHRGGWKGIGDLSQTFMSRMIRNAEVRDIPFQVSKEYLWQLYQKQNSKCALSGLPINFAEKTTDSNDASLDRIDSSQGYIKGNVQWVHKDINKMKMDLPQERFIELCKLVSQKN